MGKTNRPDTLLSELLALKRRVAQLETQQRLSAARISSGQLNVGAITDGDQIEIDAANQRIRFDSAGNPPTDLHAYGGAGAALEATGTVSTIPAQALIWNGGYFSTFQINHVEDDGSTTVASEVYTDIQDSGGGLYRGNASLSARGTDHNSSFINLSADGGVVIYNNSRTTDASVPALDSVVLYVKAQRLYYKDSSNVVHGPL